MEKCFPNQFHEAADHRFVSFRFGFCKIHDINFVACLVFLYGLAMNNICACLFITKDSKFDLFMCFVCLFVCFYFLFFLWIS